MNAIDPKLSRLALNTQPGTDRLLQAVVDESKGMPTWRPLRAVMDAELADRAGRIWMTTDQFETWRREQEILRRRRKDPINALDAVGIGKTRRRTLLHGRDTATRCEALACAHYAGRMEVPIDLESHEAFADLIETYFGGVKRVSAWLGVDHNHMANQMRGFRLNNRKERVATPLDVTIVRGLDWIVRVGAFCPYGEPRSPETFTGKGDAS